MEAAAFSENPGAAKKLRACRKRGKERYGTTLAALPVEIGTSSLWAFAHPVPGLACSGVLLNTPLGTLTLGGAVGDAGRRVMS